MRVYRFAWWPTVTTYAFLAAYLGMALLTRADGIHILFPICAAFALLPWHVGCHMNRRLEIEGDELRDYDWLGRLHVSARAEDIQGFRDSSRDVDQVYERIRTLRGDIDIWYLAGRREIKQWVRENAVGPLTED